MRGEVEPLQVENEIISENSEKTKENVSLAGRAFGGHRSI